jgi:hypothetical protein
MRSALRLKRTIVFALASAVAVGSAGDALAQDRELTEAELRDLITGKVAHWDTGTFTEYHADGTYAFIRVRAGQKQTGKWHISGNRLCYDDGNPASTACDDVYKDDRGFFIMAVRPGGVAPRRRFTIDVLTQKFDGNWRVGFKCPAYETAKAYEYEMELSIAGGLIHGQLGSPTTPGGLQDFAGQVKDDGSASIFISGLTGPPAYTLGNLKAGQSFFFSFPAQFSQTSATGTRSNGRPCTATFAKH